LFEIDLDERPLFSNRGTYCAMVLPRVLRGGAALACVCASARDGAA
jgi:hypothetical protein